jgi:hypothetical protein
MATLTAALLTASAVWVAAPALAQTPPGGSSTTSPTTAPTTPTTPVHGNGGVTTTTPKGDTTTTTVPAEPTLPDPSGRVRALLAVLNAQNAQFGVVPAQQHVADMQHGADLAAQQVGLARARYAQADDAVRASKERMGSLAIATYVDPGQSDLEAAIGGDANIEGKRAVLLSVAIARERDVLKQAGQVVAERKREVDTAEEQKRAADALVSQAEQGVVDAQKRILDASTEIGTAIAHINDSGRGSWSLPIEGDSAVTGDEIAAWFFSRGQVPEARVPLAVLTGYYISEGKDEAIRGDMAFAQSVVETGSFQNPDTVQLNNFAGLGHCDSCGAGYDFATPQLGVRAQIQLLKSYAQKSPKYVHPLVDPRLRGPAGCCKTWRELTRVWATAPNYGPVILEMYRQLLLFVVQQRGLPVPPGA